MLLSEAMIYEIVTCVLLFLISAIASPLQQTARTPFPPSSILQKRTATVRNLIGWKNKANLMTKVLECDNLLTRTFTNDRRITTHFSTVFQMCSAYPLGMGMYCAVLGLPNGLSSRVPYSYLFHSAPDLARHLHAVCTERCRCVDIAPEQPEVYEPTKERLPSLVRRFALHFFCSSNFEEFMTCQMAFSGKYLGNLLCHALPLSACLQDLIADA